MYYRALQRGLLLWLLIGIQPVFAEETAANYTVNAPYLELHSGPGRGYPVIHTLRRGDTVNIVKRKTGWLFIQHNEEQQGWIPPRYIGAISQDGTPLLMASASNSDFAQRQWEFGLSQGEVHSGTSDGTPLIAVYGSYHFTHNLSVETTLSQVLGEFSESVTAQINVTHQIAPEWLISPFLSLGVGTIETDPKATLGDTNTIENDAVNWGFGCKYHLQRNFFLRADYNKYLLLTQRDQLDKVETWKLGVGIFF